MPNEENNNPDATPLEQAAAAGDATAALLAVSTSATTDDAKKAVIFHCIVSTFFAQGLPSINSQNARIVWSTIDDNVIIAIGNGVTTCIDSKGFHSPALAPVFATLKEMNQVTVVSDLVTGIAALVTS